MGTIQIISGVLLLVASIFIIFVVLIQDSKDGGLSSAISGGSNDSFFEKNSGRTKEAKLNRLTKAASVIFFIVALAVNVVAAYVK